MVRDLKEKHLLFLLGVGLLSWLIPGGGYYLLKEKKRAVIIFVTITMTFCIGLYVGSIGVVDPVESWLWYLAQVLVSPAVIALGHHTAAGGYPVYGRPSDIGQIYTSIAGLLNLLCIVNVICLAHMRQVQQEEN